MHGFQDRGAKVRRGRFIEYGRFGRMFPYLRSLKTFKPGPGELGHSCGVMNGGRAPDPAQDNPAIKAGYTFLGQFIDHDITFDPVSVLERQIDPEATENFRTPVLELDSVYGRGPAQQPYLYDRTKPFRFLLGAGGHDLPRNDQKLALIGDPRNDENTIISQMQLLFLRFHNRVYEWLGKDFKGDSVERFEAAQETVRWHYQWIVLHEFLPRIVGQEAITEAMAARKSYLGTTPFIPVEFSVASYRFGHSQVRPGYRLSGPDGPLRLAAIFPPDPHAEPDAGADPDNNIVGDLRGGRAVPETHRINWAAFFGNGAQSSNLIDEKIAEPLLTLPGSVIDAGERSLATRNLQRGLDADLPAGQTVAAHLEIEPLSDAEVWAGVRGGEGPAPLWYYNLREASVLADGQRLAGTGAVIVARVFASLLAADKASFVARYPGWKPTITGTGRFTMSDLVNFTNDNEDVPQEDEPIGIPRAAE